MRDERIQKSSLVQEVADRIRAIIRDGGLAAHDRLPTELELVGRLGVSRTVVREAVKQLATMGLVRIERGRGTYVSNQDALMNCVRLVHSAMHISSKDLAQFIELRCAIEYYAVRHAAERAQEADVAELVALCEDMTREGQSPLQARRLDLRLHLRFVELAGVRLMRDIMEIIHEFVWEGMQRTWPAPHDPGETRALHMAIVEAIRAHDPDAAEKALRTHMELLFVRLEKHGNGNAHGTE
jgi:GntR family transcriptional repressor for pyruvate dehydrogenase complex